MERRNQQYLLELIQALKDTDAIDVMISEHGEFDQDRLIVAIVYPNMVSMSFRNDELPSIPDVVSMFESVR